MRPHQVEHWALSIIDRVRAGQPAEDARVELKSGWPEPERAARRIAGHANASRGEPILWLVGVNEKKGAVVGARHEELANWWQAVKSQFDGLHPELNDYNIPLDNETTVMALLFQTNRLPFVVKNPAHGGTQGGPVSREVPWREGTSVRSATRSDLLQLLSPLEALPSFEVLYATLTAHETAAGPAAELGWDLKLHLYVEVRGQAPVVIPLHRCEAEFRLPDCIGPTRLDIVSFGPPTRVYSGDRVRIESATIETTPHEVLIHGPGRLVLAAGARTECTDLSSASDAQIAVSVRPANADHAVPISATLSRCRADNGAVEFTFEHGSQS